MDDLPRVLVATTLEYPHTGGASTHIDALIGRLRAADRFAGVCEGGALFPSRWGRGLMLLRCAGRRDAYAVAFQERVIHRLTDAIRHALAGDAAIGVIHCHDHRAALAARRALDANRRAADTGQAPARAAAAQTTARRAAGADPRDSGASRRPAVVQTVHGPWLFEVQQTGDAPDGGVLAEYIRRNETASFQAADAIIAVDSGQRHIAVDFGAAPSKVSVIFNAIDLADVDAAARQPVTLEAPRPFFVVPRRLVPKTGVRFAVEAVAEIPAEHRPHLLVAGQGPQRQELEALAQKLGLQDRVRFLGPVPRAQLIPLMKAAAGVLVPSVPAAGVVEATSLSVIEAMALGVPAIASAIGGLAELIDHERTGLLVPPADPVSLAQAMRRVLDRRLPAGLIAAARDKVERQLSTMPWFEAVARVYRSVKRSTVSPDSAI